MPEPITTVGIGAIAAYLGKDGLQKLLGPTAEYLGDGLRDFTQRRAETIGKIFRKAADKLGDEATPEEAVPPKVLKQIIDEGSFATEELEIDYLSGVLASSKSSNTRDNRGASIASTLSSLSNYELRCHYIIYSAIRNTFLGTSIFPDLAGRPQLATFLPTGTLAHALDLTEQEKRRFMNLLSHMTFGLHRRGLIENFSFGSADHLRAQYPGANGEGAVFQPSVAGIELFLWAFGAPDQDLSYIFSPQFSPQVDDLKLSAVRGLPALGK